MDWMLDDEPQREKLLQTPFSFGVPIGDPAWREALNEDNLSSLGNREVCQRAIRSPHSNTVGDDIPPLIQKVSDGSPSQSSMHRIAGFSRSLRAANCRGTQSRVHAARFLVGKELVLCTFSQLSECNESHLYSRRWEWYVFEEPNVPVEARGRRRAAPG